MAKRGTPSVPAAEDVFHCGAFALEELTDAFQVFDFLSYLKEDLQMSLFPGVDFAYCTLPEAQNGRHLFTTEEARTGNRLLVQAEGLIGAYQLEEAFRDHDIFNCRKFAHRHLANMSEVCDLSDYLRRDLGIEQGIHMCGACGRDELWRYAKDMSPVHEFTALEVALMARLLREAWDICEANDFDYFWLMSDCNDDAGFLPGEVSRVRECLRTGDREAKQHIERLHAQKVFR